MVTNVRESRSRSTTTTKRAIENVIFVCPEWVSMKNRQNETPFEMLVKLLLTHEQEEKQQKQKQKNKQDINIDFVFIDDLGVELVLTVMETLERISPAVFERLIKYRMCEDRISVKNIKMVCALQAIKLAKNQIKVTMMR